VDVQSGHRVCNSLLFCLGRAICHIGQNADKHLLALSVDVRFDADTTHRDVGDRIGGKVEIDLIKQSGGPDRAVEGMEIRRRVNEHVDEIPDLVSPCCQKWKVIWESGKGKGEDGREWRFQCQMQDHILFDVYVCMRA